MFEKQAATKKSLILAKFLTIALAYNLLLMGFSGKFRPTKIELEHSGDCTELMNGVYNWELKDLVLV